jgi:HEAT repeat protein
LCKAGPTVETYLYILRNSGGIKAFHPSGINYLKFMNYLNNPIDISLNEFPVRLVRMISESIDESNIVRKMKAREHLVRMGKTVVPLLNKLLSSGNIVLRKEAAKIASLIADRSSIPMLIELLNDKEFEIRWIAAEGLIKTGRRSISPLLKSIRDGKSSLILNERAHHVLMGLLKEDEKQRLESLLKSLDNHHSVGETAPTEAAIALKSVFKCKS